MEHGSWDLHGILVGSELPYSSLFRLKKLTGINVVEYFSTVRRI